MNLPRRFLLGRTSIALMLALSPAKPSAQTADVSKDVPSVNAAIGPCSVEFTVNDINGKPVYDAKVRAHIAYGFMSVRKVDLEVGTNVDGKARFDGLPQKMKQPLWFRAVHGSADGTASYNPAGNCQSEHAIVVIKSPS